MLARFVEPGRWDSESNYAVFESPVKPDARSGGTAGYAVVFQTLFPVRALVPNGWTAEKRRWPFLLFTGPWRFSLVVTTSVVFRRHQATEVATTNPLFIRERWIPYRSRSACEFANVQLLRRMTRSFTGELKDYRGSSWRRSWRENRSQPRTAECNEELDDSLRRYNTPRGSSLL